MTHLYLELKISTKRMNPINIIITSMTVIEFYQYVEGIKSIMIRIIMSGRALKEQLQ